MQNVAEAIVKFNKLYRTLSFNMRCEQLPGGFRWAAGFTVKASDVGSDRRNIMLLHACYGDSMSEAVAALDKDLASQRTLRDIQDAIVRVQAHGI